MKRRAMPGLALALGLGLLQGWVRQGDRGERWRRSGREREREREREGGRERKREEREKERERERERGREREREREEKREREREREIKEARTERRLMSCVEETLTFL